MSSLTSFHDNKLLCHGNTAFFDVQIRAETHRGLASACFWGSYYLGLAQLLGAQLPLAAIGHGKLFASFFTSSTKNFAAVMCFHTGTEAMGTFAF